MRWECIGRDDCSGHRSPWPLAYVDQRDCVGDAYDFMLSYCQWTWTILKPLGGSMDTARARYHTWIPKNQQI